MVVYEHSTVCQASAGPLTRQLYQTPIIRLFLEYTIVSGFDNFIWVGSPGWAVSGWPILHSLFYTLSLMSILFPLLKRTEASTIWFPSPGASFGLWIVSWVLWASGLISAYQWVNTMCVFLWLGYHTQDDIFYFHLFACKFLEVTFLYMCSTPLCKCKLFSVSISLLRDI